MTILEMEETLVEVRASAARMIADQKEMRRSISKLEQLQERWQEKAELALSKDREDLAKQALVEKLKAADMATRLKDEVDILNESLQAYEQDIFMLQDKLREARSRQATISVRLKSAENRIRLRDLYNGERMQKAFTHFDMLERQADMAEGRADALALGSGQPKSLEDEIAELETGSTEIRKAR